MADLLDDYAHHMRRRNLSPLSIVQAQSVLTRLAEVAPLDQITALDIEAHLDASGVSPASRRNYLSRIRAFYRWALRHGRLDRDPTLTLDPPRLPRRLPRPAPDADIDIAVRYANPRLRCWLLLARYAGLRCKEIAGLRAEDILGGPGSSMVMIRDGKGGHQRALPLHPAIHEALVAYGLPGSGWLFPHASLPGQPVKPHNVSHQINGYVREFGFTAHQLRHAFGTSAYRLSQDLRLVQELMGHASPVTTAGYAAYDATKAAGVIAAMRPSA